MIVWIGKFGGLGFQSRPRLGCRRDPTLPDNLLYANFVRAGSCLGQYHKRDFEVGEENQGERNIFTASGEHKSKEKKRKRKKVTEEDTLEVVAVVPLVVEEGEEKKKRRNRRKRGQLGKT